MAGLQGRLDVMLPGRKKLSAIADDFYNAETQEELYAAIERNGLVISQNRVFQMLKADIERIIIELSNKRSSVQLDYEFVFRDNVSCGESNYLIFLELQKIIALRGLYSVLTNPIPVPPVNDLLYKYFSILHHAKVYIDTCHRCTQMFCDAMAMNPEQYAVIGQYTRQPPAPKGHRDLSWLFYGPVSLPGVEEYSEFIQSKMFQQEYLKAFGSSATMKQHLSDATFWSHVPPKQLHDYDDLFLKNYVRLSGMDLSNTINTYLSSIDSFIFRDQLREVTARFHSIDHSVEWGCNYLPPALYAYILFEQANLENTLYECTVCGKLFAAETMHDRRVCDDCTGKKWNRVRQRDRRARIKYDKTLASDTSGLPGSMDTDSSEHRD